MKHHPTKALMNGDEPMVTQPMVSGWFVSWNPDDKRWYISETDNGVAVATFADRRNAISYCHKHARN